MLAVASQVNGAFIRRTIVINSFRMIWIEKSTGILDPDHPEGTPYYVVHVSSENDGRRLNSKCMSPTEEYLLYA